jgi:hypothetical protein
MLILLLCFWTEGCPPQLEPNNNLWLQPTKIQSNKSIRACTAAPSSMRRDTRHTRRDSSYSNPESQSALILFVDSANRTSRMAGGLAERLSPEPPRRADGKTPASASESSRVRESRCRRCRRRAQMARRHAQAYPAFRLHPPPLSLSLCVISSVFLYCRIQPLFK